jgi:hypothetical protein
VRAAAPWLALAFACALSSAARAARAGEADEVADWPEIHRAREAEPPRLASAGLSVGAAMLWTSLISSPLRFGALVQSDLELGRPEMHHPFRFSAGMRAFGPIGGALVPVEIYGLGGISAAFGAWRPGGGLELGVTGLHRPERHLGETQMLGEGPDQGQGFFERAEDGGPFYLAFDAWPVCFAAGAFRVSVLELGVGTSLGPPGAALRVQLTGLRLGWFP